MPGHQGNRTSEPEIAVAVLRICADSPGVEASIADLKRLVPNYINLSPEDRVRSQTRQNEELWEQIVRNIVSHRKVEGNIIAEGFAEAFGRSIRITDAERTHLKILGY